MQTHGSLTQVQTSTKVVYTENGGTAVVTVTCDWDSKDTYTPAIGASYGDDADLKLSNVQQETLSAGLAKITLTYSSPVIGGEGVPPTTYSEQSSQIEVDIREHPDFADWADEWDDEAGAFKSSSSKYGIKSYIKGSTTTTVTSYYSSKPGSERDSIGTMESPGGDGGSSANWLLIGANRSKQGAYWALSKTYLYSAKAWDTDIYS